MDRTISFLIPAYNDESTIAKAVREAHAVGKKVSKKFEIVVVNDGSNDKTGSHLAALAATMKELRIITHSINQGYGRTIKELYYAGKMEWLFSVPGDYQVGAKELMKVLPFIPEKDMIIGWRKNRQDPRMRLFQSWIYNVLLRLLYQIPFHDINSVRLIRRKLIGNIQLESRSAFVDAELTIKLQRLGKAIIETPIAHRMSTVGGGGGKWWTIVPVIVEMIRFRL